MTKFRITAVTLSFVLAFSILFVGCKGGKTPDNGQTQNNTSQQSISSTEQQTQTQAKKEIQVVDSFNESGNFIPSGAELEFAYEYCIPRLEADSEDALKINKDIENNLLPLAKKQLEQINKDEYPSFLKINWRTEKSDDTISIIIKGDNGMSYTDYIVYCYNTETETWLTNDKLIERYKLTEQTFLDGFVKSAQEAFLKSKPTSPENEDEAEEYKKVYNSIPEYITMDSVLSFVGEDGKLKAYVPVAQFESGETCILQLLTPSF